MSDLISERLHVEAAELDVPRPPVEAILRSGRRRRRRGQAARSVATLAVVGALATTGLALRPGPRELTAQERFDRASPSAAYDRYGAFAAGTTVYIGNHRVKFEDRIKALYYTSAGVLVRAGRSAATDSSGPSRYTLIRPGGEITSVPLRMGDQVPGTDPGSPDVAYAAPTADPDRWSLVVTDVTTGREVARTTVRGRFTWGGGAAPPVDLAGERVWVELDDGWLEWNRRTGATRMVPGARRAGETAHGRYAVQGPGRTVVRDFVTGRTLADLRTRRDAFGFFSPDGRFLRYFFQMPIAGSPDSTQPSQMFLDVATGRTRTVDRPAADYGWTPDGRVLAVDTDDQELTTCLPTTGACETVQVEMEHEAVKLGGNAYES